ncbi:competence protein ComEA helix-hairpin-helix repeat protein [Ammonifex degensii KC4]|uniref:Competence protein ComEA helix-hairpin-helix repeat protein n=1 Tax=Ammonifex degensii (strain DSM 10501 / KC4) TaxID=429009 RepID=C9R8F1_AMMDK|nr:ComEA family DNA-binding protein [Ammonifex degensii]ACX52580.1 competence protein ComEA helix-hairpin-helix repeat protein [Ammonifex degensii KC4]
MTFGKREYFVALALGIALLLGLGVRHLFSRPVEVTPAPPAVEREEKIRGTVWVHVAGEVSHPGVYELPAGSRVKDALEKAGLLPTADPHALNLAQVLVDGQKIVVPPKLAEGKEGEVNNPFATRVSASSGGKINLNTADEAALQTLPGIGPTLARRIVEYRAKNGPFTSVEDLAKVPGIGPRRLEQLREYVCAP